MASMRLTTFTDYTLRTLMYLARQPARLATVAEIAGAHGISQHHLTKVVYRLGVRGVIRTVRGRNGGIMLARPACEICVGQVVRDSEPDFYIADCFNHEHTTCRHAGHCRVEDVLAKATDAFLATLDAVSLADLVLST